MTLYQECSSCHDTSKNMSIRGWNLFSLYIYIDNFKNPLVINQWTDFDITWQEYFFGQAVMIRQKTWLQGGGVYFALYIYIENFKNILVRNHWTNFNITWQKCFFGDPPPRLFKRHDTSKNMATMGRATDNFLRNRVFYLSKSS